MGFLGLGAGSGPDFTTANATAGQNQTLANTLAGVGRTALGGYTSAAPQATNVTNQAIRYDLTDPNTNALNSAAVNRLTQGNAENTQRALANNENEFNSRGLGDSSMAAGGVAGINSAELMRQNNAQNDVANQEIAGTGQRLQNAAQLAQGEANTDYGQGVGATGQASGILGNLTQEQMQQAMDKYQAEQANSGVLGGVLGGILGPASGLIAPAISSLFTKKQPAASTPNVGSYFTNFNATPSALGAGYAAGGYGI